MKFNTYLDNFRNTENELSQFIYELCEEKLKVAESKQEKITTVLKWEEYTSELKKKLINSIGGLDFKKGPLCPLITGNIHKKDYDIKKVIFQSHHNFYVTGNLYVPHYNKGKAPAIIFVCGHSKLSKAEPKYQMAAIELVMNGFVVLLIDPPGQGETELTPNNKEIKWGTQEHSYYGLSCTLMGRNIISYFIWNIIRAVDYLETLDFVDSEKIGIGGNSGGGTQSAYAFCLEDRIKVAALGCYINGRKQYLRLGHAHDSEQNIYNCMEMGFDYSEFITCASPKPVIVLSQQYDFFPIEGAIESVKKAKRVYNLYGKEENVSHVIDQQIHGLSDTLRNNLVKWFVKHFSDKEYVSHNPYPNIETEINLQCTKTGQIVDDYPTCVRLEQLIYQEYLSKKERKTPLLERINKVIPISEKKGPLLERRIQPFVFKGYKGGKIFYLTEKNITSGGIYFYGKKSNECTYMLFEEGSTQIDSYTSEILLALQKGDVFVIDTRGIGAFKNSPINKTPYYNFFGTMNKLANDALMGGTSFLAMQLHDLLTGLTLTEKDISIIAYGKQSLVALLAKKTSKQVVDVITINGITSFEQIMKCQYKFIPEFEVFNMATYFDVEELMI